MVTDLKDMLTAPLTNPSSLKQFLFPFQDFLLTDKKRFEFVKIRARQDKTFTKRRENLK